jgi:hypothetical protein
MHFQKAEDIQMHKPKGMSRKACRDLKAIAKTFINRDGVRLDISDCSVTGFHSERHDEGFSSTAVSVSEGKLSGTYEVTVESWGRDCDGRHSQIDDYLVVRTSKRRRWYMGRNFTTGRPEGKFGVMSGWTIRNSDSSQRDYSAEAAGY